LDSILTTVQYGVVTQIIVTMRVCVLEIIEAYGIPEAVERSDSYLYLFYGEESLAFFLNADIDKTYTGGVFLLSETNTEFFLGSVPDLVSWEQVSSQFDSCL